MFEFKHVISNIKSEYNEHGRISPEESMSKAETTCNMKNIHLNIRWTTEDPKLIALSRIFQKLKDVENIISLVSALEQSNG